jgi:hypothetical protein
VRWLGFALAALAAQVVGLALVVGFARGTYTVGPADITLSAEFATRGETALLFPPLGRVSAHTHALPVALEIMPARLRLTSLNDVLKTFDNRKETMEQVRRDARTAVENFGTRVAALALLGGALGALIVGLRRPAQVFGSGFLCLGITGALVMAIWQTYNPRAFDNPEYSGVLTEAPAAIEMARRGFSDLNRVRTQFRNTIANLGRTYSELTGGPRGPGEGSLVLLHVSDIHNNPVGLDLTLGLARSYQVGGVICTGDLSDYGSPLETRLMANWNHVAAPKLLIAGNHDSQATMAAVRRLRGASVLRDGEPIDWLGLRVIGWNDPVSERPGIGDAEVSEAEIGALTGRMTSALRGINPPPDLVLVHNYRAAEACAGLAPVFLYGHDHRARVAFRDNSWLIDAGTTGAAGIRFVTGARRPPFSAAVVYFSRPPAPRFQAVDLIQLVEPTGGFTVQRFTTPESAAGR